MPQMFLSDWVTLTGPKGTPYQILRIAQAYPNAGPYLYQYPGEPPSRIVVTVFDSTSIAAIQNDPRFPQVTQYPVVFAEYQAGLLAGLYSWANQWTVTVTYNSVTYTLPADEMGQNGFTRRLVATQLGQTNNITFFDTSGTSYTLSLTDFQSLMALYGAACIALEADPTAGYYALLAAIQNATTIAQLDAITIP